jgi:membrane-associated phospholipid phosphatase
MSLPNARLAEHPSLRLVPTSRPSGARTVGVLPHEIAFFVLYALVLARLFLSTIGVAWTEVLVWLAFAASSASLILLTRRHDTTRAWRIRLGGYLLLMNATYFRLATVFTETAGVRRDAMLQHIDTLLFGRPLPLYFDSATHVVASELLSFCYLLLFPYIVISCARYIVRLPSAPSEARAFYSGLFFVYALGFIGYLFVPAHGAWLDIPRAFHNPIAGGWITSLNRAIVEHGSNRVDAFPSLHVAVSAFIVFFDARFARWRFRLYLPAAVGLWISTLYLRFHYGIDVLVGALLAASALRVAFTMARRGNESMKVTPS